MSRLTIAVASGKGGTGKTTVAVSLARALAEAGEQVSLLDADVEEPNDHLFLEADNLDNREVNRPVPVADEDVCTGCGVCREVCAFNAIVLMDSKPLVFPELCHGCGACVLECPEQCISETDHLTGWLEAQRIDRLDFMRGRLKIGEAMAVPVIHALRKYEREEGITVIDAPPGTSCPVIAASRGTDYLLLVTEPTPFGLNDLRLAVDLSRALKLPAGVVINRSDMGDNKVKSFCQREGLPILMEIPFSRTIASAYARGRTLLDVDEAWHARMVELAETVRKEAAQ